MLSHLFDDGIQDVHGQIEQAEWPSFTTEGIALVLLVSQQIRDDVFWVLLVLCMVQLGARLCGCCRLLRFGVMTTTAPSAALSVSR